MHRITNGELRAIINKAILHASGDTFRNARRVALQARLKSCQSAAELAQARLEHHQAGGGNSRTDSLIAEVANARRTVSDALKAVEDFDAETAALIRSDWV